MRHFRLTGLPRCRSAFFSTLLTWGTTFCWHEKPFVPLVDPFCDVLGIADPALLLTWRMEVKDFPDAKWVVIDRNVNDELLASVQKYEPSITMGALEALKRELVELAYETKAHVIGYEDINEFLCKRMADYLEVDIGPRQRLVQMLDMNIQIHPPILKARLEALKRQQIVDTAA